MPARVTRATSRRSDTNGATQAATTERKKREHEELNHSSPSNSKRIKKTSTGGSKKEVVSTLDEEGRSLEESGISKKGNKKVTGQRKRKPDTIKEEEEAEVIVKKTRTRKRKTKEEQLEDMKPLAPRTEGLRMFIGAHVSASKGIHNSVTNSLHIGGNAFALFLKSQRKWDNPPLQDDHRDQFRKLCTEHKYDASKYVLPHGSYLVNLAQEDPAKAKQAYDCFIDDLRRCEELGIQLYNFHPGASNQSTLESAQSRLATALVTALDATKTVIPVLETTCGHGTSIGGPLSHFKSLLALIPESYHSRLGICLDTCHTFAAGYDLRTPKTWNAFMQEFDETIGLKFLRALHLNDSKTPLGSRRDLHANIGTGFLGLRAFHNLMNDKRLEGMPMILETPIDRPAETVKAGQLQDEAAVASECEHSEHEVSDVETPTTTKRTKSSTITSKTKKVQKVTAKAKTKTKPAMVEDKTVWVREIKLLESLIGMDPESEEFLALEASLAEQGREEREKHQAMFDKKREKELAKDAKQNDIRDMFGGKGKGSKGKGKAAGTRAKKKKALSDEESELSELSSLSDG